MNTTTKLPQTIIDHAKKQLSIPENEILGEETSIQALPDHLKVFYVEEKGSYGNNFIRYVISNSDMFSSAEKDSFDRLLKKEHYLEKRNLTLDQLVILFRLLKVDMRDTEVITEQDLAKGGIYENLAGRVTAPSEEETKGSVKIVFWAKHIRRSPEKWTFTIFPGYKVEYNHDPSTTKQS
jgi:hypothetical protein